MYFCRGGGDGRPGSSDPQQNSRASAGRLRRLPLVGASLSERSSPAGFSLRRGSHVIDNLTSRAGLIRRGSVIQARIPPSHEDCQILVMCSARNSAAKMLQLAIRARTPRQREARMDCQVASSYLHPLLILATAILAPSGAARTLASPIPLTRTRSAPVGQRRPSH